MLQYRDTTTEYGNTAKYDNILSQLKNIEHIKIVENQTNIHEQICTILIFYATANIIPFKDKENIIESNPLL